MTKGQMKRAARNARIASMFSEMRASSTSSARQILLYLSELYDLTEMSVKNICKKAGVYSTNR